MFVLYPKAELITVKTYEYTDKNGIQVAAKSLHLLRVKELNDGGLEARTAMGESEDHYLVWKKD